MWTIKLVIELGIRILVSIVLLLFVWKNSHWAVALSLTLIMVSMEFANTTRLRIINKLVERDRQEHKEVIYE
jgi:predicted ferric reductase